MHLSTVPFGRFLSAPHGSLGPFIVPDCPNGIQQDKISTNLKELFFRAPMVHVQPVNREKKTEDLA